MKFNKVLVEYYPIWLRDCYDSADYCIAHGNTLRAEQYRLDAKKYFDIINENWDDIKEVIKEKTSVNANDEGES